MAEKRQIAVVLPTAKRPCVDARLSVVKEKFRALASVFRVDSSYRHLSKLYFGMYPIVRGLELREGQRVFFVTYLDSLLAMSRFCESTPYPNDGVNFVQGLIDDVGPQLSKSEIIARLLQALPNSDVRFVVALWNFMQCQLVLRSAFTYMMENSDALQGVEFILQHFGKDRVRECGLILYRLHFPKFGLFQDLLNDDYDVASDCDSEDDAEPTVTVDELVTAMRQPETNEARIQEIMRMLMGCFTLDGIPLRDDVELNKDNVEIKEYVVQ